MRRELESLQFLITECKIDACQRIIEAIIPHLEDAGFTLEDFLNGLVGFFENHSNYTRTTHQLEQAVTALHHEIKGKNDG